MMQYTFDSSSSYIVFTANTLFLFNINIHIYLYFQCVYYNDTIIRLI